MRGKYDVGDDPQDKSLVLRNKEDNGMGNWVNCLMVEHNNYIIVG